MGFEDLRAPLMGGTILAGAPCSSRNHEWIDFAMPLCVGVVQVLVAKLQSSQNVQLKDKQDWLGLSVP